MKTHLSPLKFTWLWLTTIITLFISCSTIAQAQAPTPDKRFGLVESYVNSAEASRIGAGYTRITLRWDVIQPAGRDDWKPANVPDPYLEAELSAGREIVAVLIGTPDWASKGVNNSRAVPDMEAWGNFTRRIAQQYQGRIHHWVIWNEPDVWDTASPQNTWLGSEEDYLQLLKSAYSNIKGVDAGMQIHLAGLTHYWDAQNGREQYLSRLLRLLATDPEAGRYGYYFDSVVYHLYYPPQKLFDTLSEIKSLLDSYGLSQKPIWINELNTLPRAIAGFTATEDEQARFVIQAYALLMAAGAERVAFYKLRNNPEQPDELPYGLLKTNNSPRPAFAAYQTVTRYLSGFTSTSWVHQGNFYLVTFGLPTQTVTVLWNVSPEDRPFSLNAIANTATLVDKTGAEQAITAETGIYTFVLPGAACAADSCPIGGEPRLLVETGSPDQRASLLPLATETPIPTAIPTNTPIASPTPPPTATVTPQAQAILLPPQPTVLATPAPIASPATGKSQPALPANQPTRLITFNPASIFTPARILLLVVLGAVLFTVIYVIQYKLWSRRYR